MYDLIRKLTCNRLDGVQGEVSITKDTESKRSTEAYLKKKSKKDEDQDDDFEDETDESLKVTDDEEDDFDPMETEDDEAEVEVESEGEDEFSHFEDDEAGNVLLPTTTWPFDHALVRAAADVRDATAAARVRTEAACRTVCGACRR